MNQSYAALTAHLLLALSATAHAQQLPVDIELVRPAWTTAAAPGLDGVQFAEDAAPRLHLTEQYARNPLVLDVLPVVDPAQEIAVVNHRWTSTLAVTSDIDGRMAVGAALPLAVQWGTGSDAFGRDGVGLGNLQVMGRSLLITRGRYRLGLRVDGALPVGAKRMWTGGSPELSVTTTHAAVWQQLTWMADSGLRVRTPLDTGANLVVGTEWIGGTGLRLAMGRAALSTSVVGRLNTRTLAGTNGFEGLVSMAFQATKDLDLEITGGHGLTDGYGATDGRVLVGLRLRRPHRAEPTVVAEIPEPPPPAPEEIAPSPDPLPEEPAEIVVVEVPPPPPAEPPPAPPEPALPAVSVDDPIYFAQGSSTLSRHALEHVAYLAQSLSRSSAVRHVVVAGYASGEGSETVNQSLSLKRATAVYRALIEHGVSSDLLSISARGEHGEAHAATWRRVELDVMWSSRVKDRNHLATDDRSQR